MRSRILYAGIQHIRCLFDSWSTQVLLACLLGNRHRSMQLTQRYPNTQSCITQRLLTTGTTGRPPLSLPLPSCHCPAFATIAPGAAGSNSAVAAGAALDAPGPCCFCSAPGRMPPAALRPAVGLKAGMVAAEKGLAGACAASLQASVKHVPRLQKARKGQWQYVHSGTPGRAKRNRCVSSCGIDLQVQQMLLSQFNAIK
jgi:hypothetical protein